MEATISEDKITIIRKKELSIKGEYYPVGVHIRHWIKKIPEYVNIILQEYEKKGFHPNRRILLYCSGSSGAIIASLISQYLYDKHDKICVVNHIKKLGETSHHSGIAYNLLSSDIAFIVDDFINTGETIKRIEDSISKTMINKVSAIIVCRHIYQHTENLLNDNYKLTTKKIYCGE